MSGITGVDKGTILVKYLSSQRLLVLSYVSVSRLYLVHISRCLFSSNSKESERLFSMELNENKLVSPDIWSYAPTPLGNAHHSCYFIHFSNSI